MWTTANLDHISILETAFAELREQRSSQYVSYLAEPGIIDFHRDRLIERIKKHPENSGMKLLLADHRPLALIGLEESPWHQNHFGIPYYKIQPFFCFTSQSPEVERVAQAINQFCQQPASVYTTRVEAHQHLLAYHLTGNGFTPVGTSIRLIRENRIRENPIREKWNKKNVDSHSTQTYHNYTIRPYVETDLPKLQEIIRQSHRHSHFFCEARFDPERVRGLFAEWITKCASNPAFHIMVADSDAAIIGFCSAFVQRSLETYIQRSIGIIDFIVVDYRIQGKGLGRALLDAASEWFQPDTDCIELRTMADNLQAIRFYEKNGFRMLSADCHFHRWTS